MLATSSLLSMLFCLSAALPRLPRATKLEKKVYTTNHVPGFKKDFPSLWPPGYGDGDASNRIILDIGANNGDHYTLHGHKKGHTVFAFEPSPMVTALFRGIMRKNKVDVALVKMRPSLLKKFKGANRKIVIPAGMKTKKPKVYLLPVALSNRTGSALFHESPCTDLSKCGKVNHIIMNNSKKSKIKVPVLRLDDIKLPLKDRKVWFVKIDVEGHELEVIQGARKFFKETKVPYIAIEFSNNGRSGTQWGVDLLGEMYSQGYLCHHLRGFGQCHDASFKSPSLKCNYPFDIDDPRKAPSFEEYAKTFELRSKNKRRPMADLMCVRQGILKQKAKNLSKVQSRSRSHRHAATKKVQPAKKEM